MHRLLNVKILLAIALILAMFIYWMLTEASLYPINLMTEDEVYQVADKIKGVGEVKAEKLAEHKDEIEDIKDIDTPAIKYSKVFAVRNWDIRTDMLKAIFIIAVTIEGVILILLNIALVIFLTVKSVNFKYIRNNINLDKEE